MNKKKEDLNDLLTVKDIKEYLGIGINQAYELVAQEHFKVIRLGRIIRIPKEHFLNWIDTIE